MITMTTYQSALRQRVLHLAAWRSLSTLAREMQMSRNTLSAWLAERGPQNLTVRTLQKIETWCATQEAAGAHVGVPGDTERCSMQKAAMVQRIAEELGCTIGQADAAVAAVLGTVKEALRQGDSVILRRFGTWQVRAKRARVGRNPKTGAAAAIPARRVVRFVVSRTLKQAVAEVGSPAD